MHCARIEIANSEFICNGNTLYLESGGFQTDEKTTSDHYKVISFCKQGFSRAPLTFWLQINEILSMKNTIFGTYNTIVGWGGGKSNILIKTLIE